ncbi:hypothetical protein IKQ02_03765 [bacterium]|nr:hypothetical protein [bacterium]
MNFVHFKKEETLQYIDKNIKTKNGQQQYRKKLISEFDKNAKELDFYDANLTIDYNNNYFYKVLLSTENAEIFIDEIVKNYKKMFDKIIFDEVKNNKSITRPINNNNAIEIINEVLHGNYDFCNKGAYIFYDFDIDDNRINLLKK